MSHTRGSLLLWFHLQLSILLRGATSHIEFLLAGQKAVLMTFAIAARSRYTSGPLLQPFLVCKACKASVAKRQGQRGTSGSVFCEPLNRFACSPSSLRWTLHSPTPCLHPPLPLQWVSLWGGGGWSFSSASYQLGTGIIRNFYGNFHWPNPSCCPAGFTCRVSKVHQLINMGP